MSNFFQNKEYLFLGLLGVVFIIHLAMHVNNFYVPESDFFDYQEKAKTLRNLEWPDQFKRPPLYPALIAAVSLPLRGKYRELYAAEIVNFIAVLGALVLVFRISKIFSGQYAFFITWLWALHPSTIRMAIKPKPEIVVTVLILWAFDRFLRGDKKAYLGAFLATLVRYEGALAIMAFGVAEFFFKSQKIRTILVAVSAGSFIVIWTLVQGEGSGGASYGNYFNNYSLNLIFVKIFWVGLLGFLPIHLLKLWTLIAGVLLVVGVAQAFKIDRAKCFGLVLFLIGFVVMHIIWPFSNIDYIVIISWNSLLLMSLGVEKIVLLLRTRPIADRISRVFKTKIASGVGLFAMMLLVLILAQIKFPYQQRNVHWQILAPYLLVLGPYAWLIHRSRRATLIPVVSSVLIVLLVLGFYMNSKWNSDYFDIKYSKAEFRLTGEWFAENRKVGDKMVVAQPKVVAFYTSLDPETDLVPLAELSQSTPSQVLDWMRTHRVTYIAWFSTHGSEKGEQQTYVAWNDWVRGNRGWSSIGFLADGADHHGFKLVKHIKCGPRWAFVYKVENLNS